MIRRFALGMTLIGAGCRDDAVDPMVVDEPPLATWSAVCGTDGPHRLLPLEAGEHAYRVDRGADPERVLVSTFVVDPALPLSSLPPTLELRIHAIDPCGERPLVVARGLTLTSRFGAVDVACSDGGHGAWVIDPSGAQAPREIFGGWCPLRTTDVGLVTVEADVDRDFGDLVLLRDPADPADTPEVLASGVRTARNTFYGPGSNWTSSLWAKGGEALVLTEAGEVQHVDLDGGEVTTELTGVREFRASGDGRWLVWQALDPAEGEPDTPVGPVFLHDREDHTDTHLLNTHLEWTANPYLGDYLLVRDDDQGPLLFWLEGGARIDTPARTDIRGLLDDGELWLARRVDGETEELRWVPGESPRVFARHQGTVSRRGSGVEIFETDDVPVANEGSLSFVPFDGGEVERVADRVHTSRRWLADERILTIANEDSTEHGALRLIDPATGSWQTLDWNAYRQSPRLNAGDPFDGDIVFATADGGDGGRGVYRGRVD
ncbi:MAG: hypothetical protein AAF799_29135 [Myxococcota bacterium]